MRGCRLGEPSSKVRFSQDIHVFIACQDICPGEGKHAERRKMEGTLLVPPKSWGQQAKLWQAVCSVLDVLEPLILGCML